MTPGPPVDRAGPRGRPPGPSFSAGPGAGRVWAAVGLAVGLAAVPVAGAGATTTSTTGASPATATTALPATTPADDWLVYHGNALGSGLVTSGGPLAALHGVWTSPVLDGQLYGEPLVASGRVYVATENDTVYALSATTGAVMWSTHVGTPVPADSLPCGDITPSVGVTSTPVIDPGRDEIFVVADEDSSGTPSHVLVGLDLGTGAVLLRQAVDPAGADTRAILQRVALTLDDGSVVFGFGGNFGDCSSYHGWVVSVPETGGTPRTFELDEAPGDDQGSVWMGGAAPEVDAAGDI